MYVFFELKIANKHIVLIGVFSVVINNVEIVDYTRKPNINRKYIVTVVYKQTGKLCL